MKTITIDISNHDTSKLSYDVKHVMGGLVVMVILLAGGWGATIAPPVFGFAAFDIYATAMTVSGVAALIAGVAKVFSIANRDKKAHAEFLQRMKEDFGLTFKDERALVVNNIGYAGLPETVVLTDGVHDSLWSPSIHGNTLVLKG